MMLQQQGVTISDVARAAGVSKATASVALRGGSTGIPVADATRRRIEAAAQRLGYRRSGLAAALSVGRIYTVGLVVLVDPYLNSTTDINPYHKDILVSVACACARAGLRLTTLLAGPGSPPAVGDIADGRVDGVVLASVGDERLAREIFASGFPAVSIGSGYSERRVAPDNRGGVRSAVEHLAGLGHDRIAFVPYSVAEPLSSTTSERLAGFTEATAAVGISPRVCGLPGLKAMLAEPAVTRPTGLVCFNDSVALSALRAASRLGLRVPADLSIVGFDNHATARDAEPPLTTVENPLDAQAEAALSVLQALWRQEEPTLPPPVPTRLIVRDTTGPAPASP